MPDDYGSDSGGFLSPDAIAELEARLAPLNLAQAVSAPALLPFDWLDPDRRTPVHTLPQEPAAVVYSQLDRLAEYIAGRMYEAFPREYITNAQSLPDFATFKRLLGAYINRAVFNVSYSEFSAGGWRAGLERLLARPILSWKQGGELVPGASIGDKTMPVPAQRAFTESINTGTWVGIYSIDYARILPPFGAYFLVQNLLALENPSQSFGVTPAKWTETSGFVFDVRLMQQLYQTFTKNDKLPAAMNRQIEDLASAFNHYKHVSSQAMFIEFVVLFIALWSGVTAIGNIAANGLTMQNSAAFLKAVDSVPGVDLGYSVPILRVANVLLSPTSLFSNADMVAPADAVPVAPDLPSVDTPPVELPDIPVPDVTQINLPVPDLTVTPEDSAMWDDFGWTDVSVDVPVDVPVDAMPTSFDFGLDSFNNVSDSLVESATSSSGFDITKFLGDLAKTYVQYDISKRTIEAQTGRQVPPQVVRPVPGTSRQLPDGSVSRVNPDGSTTITRPTGQVQTVLPSGQIVTGGASLIPGVSNTVLLGGAAALGLVLLLSVRRR